MNIAAITRFKNGEVWKLLRKLGWSQSELARRSGIEASKLGLFINLKRKPSSVDALKIQFAFGEAGEFLDLEQAWPEEFMPLPDIPIVEQYSHDTARLEQCSEDEAHRLQIAMTSLSSSEKTDVIRINVDGESMGKIASEDGVTGGGVSARHAIALKKLRRAMNSPLEDGDLQKVLAVPKP